MTISEAVKFQKDAQKEENIEDIYLDDIEIKTFDTPLLDEFQQMSEIVCLSSLFIYPHVDIYCFLFKNQKNFAKKISDTLKKKMLELQNSSNKFPGFFLQNFFQFQNLKNITCQWG